MKLVISPGLPRSGTTYTFSQLHVTNDGTFNKPKQKEINPFNEPCTAERFKSFFDEPDDSKYYIDFSPAYLVARRDTIDNALAFDATLKRFIINLRHPVDQVYAHYLHDLKAHFGVMQYGANVWRPLFSRDSMLKYLSFHADAIERVINGVGRENILVVNFHKDLPDPAKLTSQISHFLELPLKQFSADKVGAGGWLPYYIYGGEAGQEYIVADEIFLVPPKMLLLVNGDETTVWPDVEGELATQLIQGASSWTRSVGPEQFALLYSALKNDWEKVLRLLDLNEADFQVETSMQAALPYFPSDIARKYFKKTGDMRTRFKNCSFVAGVNARPGA
ncbi:MAG: hypothetical protein P4L82_07175 [Ancalomicrobiaceae bacterium]|nr:hypothetical protein [Ancalomicrobiaceae bacterium]